MLQNNFLNFNEGYKYLTGEGKADTRGISGYLCLVIDVIFPGGFFFFAIDTQIRRDLCSEDDK